MSVESGQGGVGKASDEQDYRYIQSNLNNLVLTIDGFKNGGKLVMYPAYGGANQLWKKTPDGTLVSKTGLVADIEGGNHAEGTRCIGYYPNGGANQKWQTDDATNTTGGEIRSTMNDLVMDIAGNDDKISAFVIMWARKSDGDANQKWKWVKPDEIKHN